MRPTIFLSILLAIPGSAKAAQILTTNLPPATVGQAYQTYIDAENGDAATYVWDVQGLPDGLHVETWSGRERIVGVATSYGTYPLDVSVMDGDGSGDTARLGLEVKVPHGQALPEAERGRAYSTSIQVEGGTAPVVYTVGADQLPSGLTLDPSGTIAGTVDRAAKLGSYPFTVVIRDAVNRTASLGMSIKVVDPIDTVIVDPPPHRGGCSSAGGFPTWLGLLALAIFWPRSLLTARCQ